MRCSPLASRVRFVGAGCMWSAEGLAPAMLVKRVAGANSRGIVEGRPTSGGTGQEGATGARVRSSLVRDTYG
jgi:hypothetical protein